MASLEELRAQLGSVDDKIVELYEERMKLCEEIGICKIENGYKTFDRQREKNTITDVMNKVSSDINKKGIGEVYEQLLAISRKLQYKQLVEAGALGRLPFIGIDLLDKDTARVVFQGTEGAYSQAAMEHYFGKDCNNYHVHTFREAMEAIEEGAADYAVLPIENSTAGAVNGKHARRQKVGADKVRGAILCPLLVAAADVAILFPLVGLVSLLIEDAPAIGAEQHTGEQAHFIIAVGAFALLA